jgi:hypothetical protein
MTDRIEVITADGVAHDLDECVTRGVDGVAGLVRIAAKRGSNLVVPGEHGERHIPGKRYGAANVVLPLWVRGVLPDGSPPGGDDIGARLAFHANLRTLAGWFVVDEQVTIRHTLTDGTAREITGEVTDAIEPTVTGAGRHTIGQLTVALNCADPFWSDIAAVTATVDAGAPVELVEFAGASAPMEDLQLVFGPQSNPRLAQPTTGVFVTVARVISTGQTITVETGPFAGRPGWEVYGSPGVGPGLYEDLSYGGRGTSRWFALRPNPGGRAPVVELTNTSGGGGQVTITGRRRYKIA